MLLLEGVRVPTNSTAESKFFSCSWMLYMKRTFLENIVFHQAVQLLTSDLPLGPVQLLSVPRGIEAAQPLGYSPLAGSRHGSSEKEESSSETYVWSSRSLIYSSNRDKRNGQCNWKSNLRYRSALFQSRKTPPRYSSIGTEGKIIMRQKKAILKWTLYSK